LIALVAYFQWVQALNGAPPSENLSPDTLPDQTRQSIHLAMTRLENLTHNPDKKIAAGAWESLGVLHLTFGSTEAVTDFRQAIALDPTRETSWDLLLGTMRSTSLPEDVETACRDRIAAKDSPRNRLLLAKFCATEGKWSESARQAQIAGAADTNNIVPLLLLAAVALKQSAQTNQLTSASQYLHQTGDMLKAMPPSAERYKRWREFVLNTAILDALAGHPESSQTWLNEVFKGFPDDEDAREIAKAIGPQ
jgi:hypothetical protein